MMKQNKLLNIFLITLPILDLLTSLNNRILENFISVGLIIKGIVILISYIYIFFNSASKFKKTSIVFYSCIIIYIFAYFLLKVDLIQFNILLTEIKYIMKLIYFPVIFILLLNLYDESGFEKEDLTKIMLFNLICYIILITVPTLLDINFKSYSNSNYFGSVGWYYAANEVSTILLLLFPFIYTLLKKHLLPMLILFGGSLYTISLIGTKVTLFGIIIITFLIFISTIIKEKRILSKYAFITLSLFLITTFFMINNYSAMNLKNSLTPEQEVEIETIKNELSEKYEETENDPKYQEIKRIAKLLLSSRDIYALNSYHIYIDSFKNDYILLGMGFSNTTRVNNGYIEKLAEIDFIDVFFHLGLVGLFIMLFPFIYAIYYLFKYRKKNNVKLNSEIFFYNIIILLTLGISSTAGHVYLAPAVTIYIAIYYVYLLNEFKAFNKKEIIKNKITILGLHMGYGGVENVIANTANMLSNDYEIEIISFYKKEKQIPYKINKNIEIKYLLNFSSNREEFKKAVKVLNIIKIVKEGIKATYILINKNILIKREIINSDSKIIISTRYNFSKILNKFGKENAIKIHQEHTYTINKKYIKKLNNLQSLDYVMPVSKALLKKYQNKVNIKLKYIPLALNYYPQENEVSNLNNNNLIAIGRLEKEKNMIELIYIIKELVTKNSTIKLNIFGDGSEKEKINNLIKEYNLENNIKLWGFKKQDEIKETMKDSALLLMTSKEESFGLVLIEAMSYGVPCIAYSTAEGAKDIINNKTGYLINDYNREEYINTIKKYLELSLKDKRIIGKEARKFSENYKYEKIQKEWLQFIKEKIRKEKNQNERISK